jgi:hypothetical protein
MLGSLAVAGVVRLCGAMLVRAAWFRVVAEYDEEKGFRCWSFAEVESKSRAAIAAYHSGMAEFSAWQAANIDSMFLLQLMDGTTLWTIGPPTTVPVSAMVPPPPPRQWANRPAAAQAHAHNSNAIILRVDDGDDDDDAADRSADSAAAEPARSPTPGPAQSAAASPAVAAAGVLSSPTRVRHDHSRDRTGPRSR